MSTLSRRALLRRAGIYTATVVGLISGCSTNPAPSPSPASAPPVATSPGASSPVASAAAAQSPSSVAKAAPPTASPAVAATAGAVPAATSSPTASASGGPPPQLVVVRGEGPAALTRAAVAALGGMGAFVEPGQRVLIKPNICVSREPQYAATTNPEVVATLVTLCREAGAAKVVVFDQGFSGVSTAYKVSGIEAAVTAAGGEMGTFSRLKYKTTPIPQGKDIKSWSIYEDALTYDVLINVPIAKNHDLAQLTLRVCEQITSVGCSVLPGELE